MFCLRFSQGFSTLQSVATLLVFAVSTGTALQMMPEVLDNADQIAARHAAASEAMHKEVWDQYIKASTGQLPGEQIRPQPIRHNLEIRDGLVASPLGKYCFAEDAPGDTLTRCPASVQASVKAEMPVLRVAGE